MNQEICQICNKLTEPLEPYRTDQFKSAYAEIVALNPKVYSEY